MAQTEEPTPLVPALTGLSVPEAAAQLNRAGFRLGDVGIEAWFEGMDGTTNTVASQSIDAGSDAAPGIVVDVAVWRSEKAVLIFDDNDITLQNTSAAPLSLRRVAFISLDGQGTTQFDAEDWNRNRLQPGECVQLWSVERIAGKEVDGCASVEKWLSITVPDAHFWTGINDTTAFQVVQDNIQRGTCIITEQQCEFYLALAADRGRIASDVAEYVYLRYTPDWLQLMNRTEDRWLPTTQLMIGGVKAGDTAQYSIVSEVANVMLLAPGQCLLWTRDSSITPEACDTVATASVDAPFWITDFNVSSEVNGLPRSCPPAEADKVAVCLLPRLQSPE